MSDLVQRLERALQDLTGAHYPLPWQVARRSYDHEQVVASGNLVLASGLACAGNTEQRKALVEIVNSVPEIIAALNIQKPQDGQ